MTVPNDWWKAACEAVSHPMACVGTDSRFIWVNPAFERLVGYSVEELHHRTWMDITIQPDVGGDLASVEAVLRGDIPQYSMAKRYRHKLDHVVPVTLTVWRFPKNVGEVLSFIVEAVPETATTLEVEALRKELTREIAVLQAQVKQVSQGAVHVSYAGNTDVTGEHNQVATNGGRAVAGAPQPPRDPYTLVVIVVAVCSTALVFAQALGVVSLRELIEAWNR